MNLRSVEVCTVYTPRPGHPQWRDYLPLLQLQRQTAQRYGHQHVVVTDTELPSEFVCIKTRLSSSLMKAMIEGVIARLVCGGNSHVVFVDVDCLINRNLQEAFPEDDHDFDLLLTQRENEVAPINNGAMYASCTGFNQAWGFFNYALSLCGDHWGADQEAISQAAMPMARIGARVKRQGCRVKFESMKPYNTVPKEKDREHVTVGSMRPFVIHFKGAAKDWMPSYASKFSALAAD